VANDSVQPALAVLQINGDFCCTCAILVNHIGTQIALWVAADEHQVLLITDADSDVYRGILATRLAEDGIQMSKKGREIHGAESPASHSTGYSPITGIFANTSGIDASMYSSQPTTASSSLISTYPP
jgi:hypothetical protein